MNAFVLTVLVALGAWAWSAHLRARELALAVAAEACRSLRVQFLDDTVAISRIGVGRGKDGRLHWQRVYTFEFTTDGGQRREGQVALQGLEVKAVQLDHPDGPVVIAPGAGR